jgi:pSer/pThr/pTyr-binding forkhead associated (FHA) protein
MVQLKFLTGKQPGRVCSVQRFPCLIGRSPDAGVRVEEGGVWEKHLELMLCLSEGFILRTLPNSLASINGQRFDRVRVRNGDTIEIGSLKMQFWLDATRQRSLRAREILTWVALGILSLGQVGLIYWLCQ